MKRSEIEGDSQELMLVTAIIKFSRINIIAIVYYLLPPLILYLSFLPNLLMVAFFFTVWLFSVDFILNKAVKEAI